VHGAIRDRWLALGGGGSWLGYPLTDETQVRGFSGYGRYNKFQGGYVYYYPDSGAVEVRDLAEIFESRQAGSAFRKSIGKRKLLTILYNPHVAPHDIDGKNPDTSELSLPTGLQVEATLFGTQNGSPIPGTPKASVSDFFRENSSGKLELQNAGILGPFHAPVGKWGNHYWDENQHTIYRNDGWLNGHHERKADAIRAAAASFDFKQFDVDSDGKLTPDELAIIVLCPQIGQNWWDDWGAMGRAVGGYTITYPTATTYDLKVDGVTISGKGDMEVFEWFAHAPDSINSNPLSLGLPAHELGHLLTGIPDLYDTGWRKDSAGNRFRNGWNYDSGVFSRMGAGCSACEITHFDPFHKLKMGWLNYTLALGSGTYTLRNVEEYGEGLILYDPNRGRNEYFILEYRSPGTSYDAGRGNVGGGFPLSQFNTANAGLAVWHIVEDEGLQKKLSPPKEANNWYRKGVLLVRADGRSTLDDSRALFTTRTSPLVLRWSDNSVAGFNVTPLDATDMGNPPYAMRLSITVTH
jgi:M6 family metalloprotease-like protein